MNPNYLDFEQPIVEIETQIRELQLVEQAGKAAAELEVKRLIDVRSELIEEIFSSLSAWQIAQLSRHALRPHTLDYIERFFTEFDELHGDRCYADDRALITGIARLDRNPVVVIGHQKGREVSEKVERNFGMPKPEGYRKAYRIMQLAERFKLPIITFIDTPGAYPGVGAEERGQSQAIAQNLELMSHLNVPVMSVVIGEGGSGGALAIGVSDYSFMLQYSMYSVISPEGCASILWKKANRAADAAEAMAITAERLNSLGLIDEIVPEPLGGAHRDMDLMAATLKKCLVDKLDWLLKLPTDELIQRRDHRIRHYGL